MKTCLLNLPHQKRIMRRYNCTYHAPNFLFPPLELMSLGAIVKKWKKDECILIDAIAQRLSLKKVIGRLKDYEPDLLVFMAGIEPFEEDMLCVKEIKSCFPSLKIVALGYIPSLFPKETLANNAAIDYIIMGEPELSFSELYDNLKDKNRDCNIAGIASRKSASSSDRRGFLTPRSTGQPACRQAGNVPPIQNNRQTFNNIVAAKPRPRIRELDGLPFPDRSLINIKLYHEFLLKRPFTTVQTARGCPFECAFCVSTYGRDVTLRSADNVLAEIEELGRIYGIKTMRFMDDTFTLDKKRVMDLCLGMVRKGLHLEWSCLSRVDTLDKQILKIMKGSGCRRIYLGIESGSQRVLDFYRKGYDASRIKAVVKLIKDNTIQVVGFFIVGGIQTREELAQDIVLAKELRLDYIVAEKLSSYPGTPFSPGIGGTFQSRIVGKNILAGFRNPAYPNCTVPLQEAVKWEKEFYRDFYLRPGYLTDRFKDLIFNIRDSSLGGASLLKYLFARRIAGERPEMI